MRRSTDRILTTHAGSLPRPAELADMILARENATLDPTATHRLPAVVTDAVAESVRTQIETGLDVISDGEMSKIGYATYVKERLSGVRGRRGP